MEGVINRDQEHARYVRNRYKFSKDNVVSIKFQELQFTQDMDVTFNQ